MSMILVFNRKVIPIPSANPKEQQGRVECQIVGVIEGEPLDIGQINFPTKQSWTKFWGAVQRGSLNVPDMEVKMLNVPLEEPQAEGQQEPLKKWVGNSLV
jgi:hypothetical protein